MRKIEFSVDKKKEIIDMYMDKSIHVSDICKCYNISNAVLNRLLREEGVPFRLEKATGKRTNIPIKKCDICNRSVMLKDASFCPFCGHDVRSKSERLCYKLSDLWNLIYPNFDSYEQKQEAKELFDQIADHLKNN